VSPDHVAVTQGFKGSPEAVVYHPADGRPVVYKLESPQQSQKLMQMAHGAAGKPKEIEVDSRTLAGSIARAHKMGLQVRVKGSGFSGRSRVHTKWGSLRESRVSALGRGQR
jgi:hypothetical protein